MIVPFSALRCYRATASVLLALLLVLARPGAVAAQVDSLSGIAGKLARYELRGPQEKLFLHLDRPLYLCGETMWFRVYAADGTSARPLALSSVAYVEVLDSKHQAVLQGKIALKNAAGQGSFVLPAGLASGSYTVRAYTNWMKNFAPETYFQSSVTVLNTLAASGAAPTKTPDSLAYDVQFFPEGGNLVGGLRSTVAFKVTDSNGRGVAATGKVMNRRGDVVASFVTLRMGMGSFAFTPAAGQEAYTAVLTPAGEQRPLRRALPRAYAQGYVLHLDSTVPRQLTLTVNATTTQPETLALLVRSRQQTVLTTRLHLLNGHATVVLNPDQLLAGVSHFTLFNSAQQPVCERLYFRCPTPDQLLAPTVRADKAQYTTRDKVSLQVALAKVGTQQNEAVSAHLSMAVYRLDSLAIMPVPAIAHYLWLTSELKGTVEAPDYYFTASGPQAVAAVDNLMLTQGWSRFRWEEVLTAPFTALPYSVETNGHVVQARLTWAGTTLPRAGIMTYLVAPSRIIHLTNARSDDEGLVQFEPSNLTGTQDLILQTDPQQDSTCHISILDPFSTRFAPTPGSAYGLTARFLPDYEKRHLQVQLQNAYFGKYRSRYAQPAVDSLPFYGKPSESYLLDKYTRFKVLEEVLREYVPGVVVRIRKDGFHFLVADKVNQTLLDENPMVLLDGLPVFNTNRMMAMPAIKIRKLEVVDSRYFHGLAVYNGIVSFSTYKGDLEGFPLDPHVLVQQYEGVQRQREFYAPRYDTPSAQQNRLPDLRNLLYWNPDISLTGADTRTLDFYTGDQAGHYLVVTQGLAANGQAGSHRFVLEVKSAL